jgi:hypothetical protein
LVSSFTLKSRQDVAVRVHRQAHLAVAERFHNHARMHALDE